MCGPSTLPAYVPPGQTSAYASFRAWTAQEPPIARILTRAKVNTAWGRPAAFQIRAQTPDGTYWSGRSSGGGPIVTLRRVALGSPLHRYLVEYHPTPKVRT
ncbi:hypothetical protein [Caudoviricetes sp.]|nr:hypothetical protein [Caudoviricetes sp.]